MIAMLKIVVVLLVIFGAAIVIGGIIAWVAIRRARDGFEDDEGFHPTNHSKPR
jgi:hypothetical protein